MRFTRVKLVNYVGIYNGLGLNEIEIDFTKCKHDTVVIKGPNGSGKSTLLNALSVLPDSNDKFIPNKPARKEIDIMSNGTLYLLSFIHDVRSTGTRMTSKAYVKKRDINGIEVEMNPNGNITSFRDLIYSEFLLDPNFESLSRLGSEDRGIVDKTPAERKVYVSSIIDNIEVYNNMHKTLSKRISNLNVLRNRLISRIDQIGERKEIEPRLKLLDNKINKMMLNKDKIIENIASEKSTINLLDPNDKIQDKFIFYTKELNKGENIEHELKNRLSKLLLSINIKDDIDAIDLPNLYLSTKDELSYYKDELNKINNKNMYNLKIKEDLSKENIDDEIRISSLKNEMQLSNLEDQIAESEKAKEDLEKLFLEIGFKNNVTLTKDEYLLGINCLMEIFEVIDNLKSNQSQYIIESAIDDYILKNKNIDLEEYDIFIEEYKNNINNINISIERYRELKELRRKLNNRPPECIIDSCSFIADSIGIEDLDYDKIIEDLYNEVRKLEYNIENLEKNKKLSIEIGKVIYNINKIVRLINSNISIIKKLPNMENILNKENLFHRIKTGYDFGEIQKLYSYVSYCDAFNDYQIITNSLSNLYIKLDGYKEKIKIISELKEKIKTRNKRLNEIYNDINKNSIIIEEYQKKINEYEKRIDNLNQCISINNKLNDIKNNNIYNRNSIAELEFDMQRINTSIRNIKDLEEQLHVIQNQITPLLQDRDQLIHNLKLLDEYEEELKYINGNYEKTELVRYHCTPTTGIQIIYIEAYMNKTLSMTNELLKHVFDGEFEIMPYIINDREFRIPVNAEGLPRDDISSLSNSQKSIISMIVSFVLLEQSSSKYNILRLDEIDSPLDEVNRIRFTFLMDTLKEILDVGQCIMISHNNELDLSNCDIIVLKTEPGMSYNGNVIYQN